MIDCRVRNLIESFAFDNEPDWLRYLAGADPVIKGYYKPAGKGYIDRWRHWHQRDYSEQRIILGGNMDEPPGVLRRSQSVGPARHG
jgi:hypothetical protein